MEPAGARRRYRVLVVEDCPDTAEMTCSLLEVLGHESRMVSAGRVAVEEASRFAPQIVILDLALPDICGLDVARALRARAGARPLYIVALTGCTDPQDRDAAFAAGCDQYVLKPGSIAMLLQTAGRRLAGAGPRPLDHASSRTAVRPEGLTP